MPRLDDATRKFSVEPFINPHGFDPQQACRFDGRPQLRIAENFREFGIERVIPFRPIDGFEEWGNEQFQRRLEKIVECIFPRTIEFARLAHVSNLDLVIQRMLEAFYSTLTFGGFVNPEYIAAH